MEGVGRGAQGWGAGQGYTVSAGGGRGGTRLLHSCWAGNWQDQALAGLQGARGSSGPACAAVAALQKGHGASYCVECTRGAQGRGDGTRFAVRARGGGDAARGPSQGGIAARSAWQALHGRGGTCSGRGGARGAGEAPLHATCTLIPSVAPRWALPAPRKCRSTATGAAVGAWRAEPSALKCAWQGRKATSGAL